MRASTGTSGREPKGPALAQRLERDFRADLAKSHEVTREEWQRRRLGERVLAGLGAVLERHQ